MPPTLKERAANAEARVAALEKDAEAAEARVTALEEEKSAAVSRVGELEQQLAGADGDGDVGKVAALEERLTAEGQRAEAAEARVEELTETLVELQDANDAQAARIAELSRAGGAAPTAAQAAVTASERATGTVNSPQVAEADGFLYDGQGVRRRIVKGQPIPPGLTVHPPDLPTTVDDVSPERVEG